MTQMIAMPAVMTDEMRNHWRSAFLSGLHNRRGRGVVGDARKLKNPSAEEAAWNSLVKKYGVPIEDDGGDALSSGRLGALFLGRRRAVEPEPEWVAGQFAEEHQRLTTEVASLREEREGLVGTVCFNEATYDAKMARLTEIDRLLYCYLTSIDTLIARSL